MFLSDGSYDGRFIPKHILDDINNLIGVVFCLLSWICNSHAVLHCNLHSSSGVVTLFGLKRDFCKVSSCF